jgi:hypothetical protein
MTYYIYCLEIGPNQFYIGQTGNIDQRIASHRCRFGWDFEFFILEETDEFNVLLLECMWMQLYKTWGLELLNKKPWMNVNLNQQLHRGQGRKMIDNPRTTMFLYIPKNVIMKMGKKELRRIAEQAIEEEYHREVAEKAIEREYKKLK